MIMLGNKKTEDVLPIYLEIRGDKKGVYIAKGSGEKGSDEIS